MPIAEVICLCVKNILFLKKGILVMRDEKGIKDLITKIRNLEDQILEQDIEDLEMAMTYVQNYPDFYLGKDEELAYLSELIALKKERGR